jgi:hypothetical protein
MDTEREINLKPVDFNHKFNFVKRLKVIRDIDPILAWGMMSCADV